MAQPRFPSRTFRIDSPFRALRVLLAVCIAFFVVMALTLKPDQRWILAVLTGVMVFALSLATTMIYRARLEISESGIVLYAPGYRVRSTWDNLQGYKRRIIQTQPVEVLVLRVPDPERSWWVRAGRKKDMIPVGMFDKNWRTGELGAMIKQYAPHAYDHWLG